MRKQARHLENDIDIKLVAFSKVGAGAGGVAGPSSANDDDEDTAPLLREGVYGTLSTEIEQMLNKVCKEMIRRRVLTYGLNQSV